MFLGRSTKPLSPSHVRDDGWVRAGVCPDPSPSSVVLVDCFPYECAAWAYAPPSSAWQRGCRGSLPPPSLLHCPPRLIYMNVLLAFACGCREGPLARLHVRPSRHTSVLAARERQLFFVLFCTRVCVLACLPSKPSYQRHALYLYCEGERAGTSLLPHQRIEDPPHGR